MFPPNMGGVVRTVMLGCWGVREQGAGGLGTGAGGRGQGAGAGGQGRGDRTTTS